MQKILNYYEFSGSFPLQVLFWTYVFVYKVLKKKKSRVRDERIIILYEIHVYVTKELSYYIKIVYV